MLTLKYVLILITIQGQANAQFITNFSEYSIQFEPNNNEYLHFQGVNTTMYLAQKDDRISLFIADGYSHSVFQSIAESKMLFSYSNKTFFINSTPMMIVIKQGNVTVEGNFQETFIAPIYSMTAGPQLYSEVEQITLCKSYKIERLLTQIVLVCLAIIAVISNNELIKTTLQTLYRSNFPRKFLRSGSILSISQTIDSNNKTQTSI